MGLVILVVGFVLVSTSGYADIVNGGFEDGLKGWTAAGNYNNGNGSVQVLTQGDFAANDGSGTTISAPDGTHYALVSNGGPGSGGASPPYDTTTLTSIPYFVSAGASISFDYDFFTAEFPGFFTEPFFAYVLQGGAVAQTIVSGDSDGAQNPIAGIDCSASPPVVLAAPDGTQVCTESGVGAGTPNWVFQSVSNFGLNGYAGQIIQFQFVVSEAGDNFGNSALLVDDVHGIGLTDANTVPEPHSWIPLLVALILLYVALRRRAQHR
jgi:hypothetical protein